VQTESANPGFSLQARVEYPIPVLRINGNIRLQEATRGADREDRESSVTVCSLGGFMGLLDGRTPETAS
jgi:hypothetical protein